MESDEPELMIEQVVDPLTWTGYQPDFLGADLSVPLPAIASDHGDDVLQWRDEDGEWRTAIDYPHFSVVMSVSRRLAWFSAINCDASKRWTGLDESRPKWTSDKRIPEEAQVLDSIYGDRTNLDRGHLTRREDAEWGDSPEEAELAARATHFFPNCSPQHERFNQDAKTWRKVEDHILKKVAPAATRITVFTGPVLDPEDIEFEQVLLPRQFWKVVVGIHPEIGFRAAGFVLTQEKLIAGFEEVTDGDVYGPISEWQWPIADLEDLIHLDFGDLREYDALAFHVAEEGLTPRRRLTSVDDIVV